MARGSSTFGDVTDQWANVMSMIVSYRQLNKSANSFGFIPTMCPTLLHFC